MLLKFDHLSALDQNRFLERIHSGLQVTVARDNLQL